MDEFELIARLTRGLPQGEAVVAGPGDDCAVLDFGLPDRWLLFKADAVVEGIHFLPDTAPERIGHKALARCLSDIAAMAGDPTAALVTLASPPALDPARLDGIYAGMRALADRFRVSIVGGETTTNPDRLLLSIALLGTVPKARCTLRSGARSGDAIFVTDELGGSRVGKHLDFIPRLTEAGWLADHFRIHSMIDLSDGLAGDLRHILSASNVGAELLAETIPISRAARAQARQHPTTRTRLQAALTDGEDFELVFTVASPDAVPLLDAWRARFPELRLSCIGRITSEPGLRIRDRKGIQPVPLHGYAHFQQS